MYWRTTLAVVLIAAGAQSTKAGNPFGCNLFGHTPTCCQPKCSNCQVHVHYCKPPAAEEPLASPPQTQFSPQMLYSPILPSAVGYTMPMMPMMSMPVAYQQQAYNYPQPQNAPQTQNSPRDASCGECEDRIVRLESGVKNLSERMDKIEIILQNQTALMEKLASAAAPVKQ